MPISKAIQDKLLEWLLERNVEAGMLPDGSFVVPNSWLEPTPPLVFRLGDQTGQWPRLNVGVEPFRVTIGGDWTPIDLGHGETTWSRVLPEGTEVSGAEPQLWSVRPVSVLHDMIVEWADVCDGCANEARRAMDVAQSVGALQMVIVICGAEIEGGDEAMEEAAAAAAQNEPSCVACVDGDEVVVLPDDAAIERFIAWCRENVTW